MRRAESSSDKSSRAVFAAYGSVLAEQGLQPSDDAVLHRFLFLMQKHRRSGEELVPRFKRVLKDAFKIDVEIDEDGEGIEVTTNLDATRNGAQASLGRYSRRGSFDSFFDGTADKVAGTDYGDLPVRTRRGSQGGAPNGHVDRRSQRRSRSETEAHSYHLAPLPIRTRVNGKPHGYTHRRTSSGQHRPLRRRSVSVSSRGSLQIRRDVSAGTSRYGDDDGYASEYTGRTRSLDLSNVQIPGVNAPIPDDEHESFADHRHQYIPEPFQPSDTRLMDDAETLEDQRLHRVTRDCLRTWRNRTQERKALHEDMQRQAIAFDRKILHRVLLRLSFDRLQDTARARRSNRETDRFFTRLETRADKARNIFLLTKAFTHWAKSAEDEVQRTSVARRHILRTRFFNGWRDITAVNELKIQHFILAKFLHQWRVRAATVRDNAQFAVVLYEENLVQRVYKDWFFKFCIIAAPAWRNDWVRRTTLQKMVEIAKVLREREVWARERYQRTALRRTFHTWQQRMITNQARQNQANERRSNSLLSSALHSLHKQMELQPLLRKFETDSNSRLLRTTLQTWRKFAQQSRQARTVDRLRVLRNAYTAWNDRLRIKALEDRINDRVIVESLYRWTLASRVSLFVRVHDRQLKESMFLAWVTKTNQRANTLDAAERRFAQFKRTQLLRTCMRRMEAITAEKRAEEFAVVAEYQQKLKQRIFDNLKQKQEHFQELNGWSKDARYYVLSKRTLKTWSEASQHARRNRRRDAYSQVRRAIKTNLVRRTFEAWREKANRVAFQQQQATDVLENRIQQSSTVLLHRWHDRTIVFQQQNTQATNVYNYKLGTHYYNTWATRTEAIHALMSRAVALRQESTEIAATSALKKLGWRLWNMKRQEETARALYGRNFEKHVRAMIRFWFEQTTERLANRPVSPTPTSRSRGGRSQLDGNEERRASGNEDVNNQDEDLEDQTHHLEAWTAFDETALGLQNDIDLSLSLTPDRIVSSHILPPASSSQPLQPPPSILRPNTFPQPASALRPPPTIFEDDQSDMDFAAQSTFWSGTPLPPPPTTASKPGYLKTPSKRSVARAKRPELPASPEKRPIRAVGIGAGSMSAPPARMGRPPGLDPAGDAARGVTSFERRLREGGFGASVGSGGVGMLGGSRARGRGRGKGRVGFGDVSEMG